MQNFPFCNHLKRRKLHINNDFFESTGKFTKNIYLYNRSRMAMLIKNRMEIHNSTLPQIKLGMLQASDHAIIFDKIAIIDDNLDPEQKDKRIGAPVNKPLPTKILVGICLMCIEGSIDLKLNQTEYHMEKNDCLLGMPGFIAEHISMSGECKMIVIAAAQDFLGKSPMKGTETARKWMIQKGEPSVIHFPDEICSSFLSGYKCFRQTYDLAHQDYRNEILICFLHTALALFSSWLKQTGETEHGLSIPRKKDLVMKFLNDVHEFCNKERSVSFYAERCCLSPKYFAKIITDAMGRKPGDIIKDNVILEAKVLLIAKSYSIQQVSDKLNFPNPSFFCKYFKAATGTTPRKYQLRGEKATDKFKDSTL